MNARTIVLTLVTAVGLRLCFAEDANMGTWKLNEAKSKIGAGSPKLTTVVYEAAVAFGVRQPLSQVFELPDFC